LTTSFIVHHREQRLGRISLGMPGKHNVVNSLGAIAIAMELQVSFEACVQALDGFSGVQRRFSVRGEEDGVLVVDDYGHHPTEIVATLRAAAEGFPKRRVIAVFQPHRYSRVSSLWSDFCGSFNGADTVVVCPVYAAGETPMEGISAEHIAAEMRERGYRGTQAVDSLDAALAWLVDAVRPGDVVITLGAGNVNQICERLLESLRGRP
jgi:UDP-N-acetylmuramate--alanine ligase